MKVKKIFVIAGEASGDIIGASVVKQLRNKGIDIRGLGGPEMLKAGMKSVADYSALNVMGFIEVLPQIFKIKKIMDKVILAVEKFKPDVILTIDSPGFNFQIVEKLRAEKLKAKYIHLVSPAIWAWKEKRKYRVAKLYDKILTLFSFEPPYYKGLIEAVSVGHPIVEQGADKGIASRAIGKYSLPKDKDLIGILPGSRMNEVKRILPVFLEAAARLNVEKKNVLFLIPVVANTSKFVKEELKKHKVKAKVLFLDKRSRYDVFAALMGAVAASGTVSLELGLAGVPHVIAYKLNSLSVWFIKRFIKIKYADIFNLLADKELIKEYIQDDFNADNIYKFMLKFWDKKEMDKMKKNLANGVNLLRDSNLSPSRKIVLEILK